MKIKLVILCEDHNYLNRISSAFNNNYANRVELVLFSKADKAVEYLQNKRVDVFLCDASTEYDLEVNPVPEGFAYLIDTPGLDQHNGKRAICKYQKLDQIYNGVLEIFSECMPENIDLKLNGNNGRIVTFLSPVGGAGTTSLALAYAKMMVNNGKTALYLDISKFGDCTDCLSGEGHLTFSDVLFALKSNKPNMALKIEGAIRKDPSGVCFFAPVNNLLDMNEFTELEFNKLIECLASRSLFDYIVLDVSFGLDDFVINILDKSFDIVMATDGSTRANQVTEHALQVLEIIENQRDMRFLDEVYLVYNKFREDASVLNEYSDMILARIPDFYTTDRKALSDHISTANYLKQIGV